jgi:DNA-binding NtrC family response regulator
VVFRDDRPMHLESSVSQTPADRHIDAAPGSIDIPPAGKSLRDIEREAVELTMSLTGHNQSAAARILGISRPTLLRKIREHAITIENARRFESEQAAKRVPARPGFVRRPSPFERGG